MKLSFFYEPEENSGFPPNVFHEVFRLGHFFHTSFFSAGIHLKKSCRGSQCSDSLDFKDRFCFILRLYDFMFENSGYLVFEIRPGSNCSSVASA